MLQVIINYLQLLLVTPSPNKILVLHAHIHTHNISDIEWGKFYKTITMDL